jgi:hypothetical protein
MKPTSLLAILAAATTASASDSVAIASQTWFGWPDNCQDGYTQGCGNNNVAYNCAGRDTKAGGDSSFSNPLTYATKEGGPLHKPCDVTWFPYLKKYLVMQDICTGCKDRQIDIWIGNGDGGQPQLDCEVNSPSGGGHHLIRKPANSHHANSKISIINPPRRLADHSSLLANALWSERGGCRVSQNVYPKST